LRCHARHRCKEVVRCRRRQAMECACKRAAGRRGKDAQCDTCKMHTEARLASLMRLPCMRALQNTYDVLFIAFTCKEACAYLLMPVVAISPHEKIMLMLLRRLRAPCMRACCRYAVMAIRHDMIYARCRAMPLPQSAMLFICAAPLRACHERLRRCCFACPPAITDYFLPTSPDFLFAMRAAITRKDEWR